MLYFIDTIRSLAVSMRNVLRKPTTVHFPKERRPRGERFRASFALLHDELGDEMCVGCKACERICPSEVITVELEKRESAITGKKRAYAKSFTLDQNACIYCELCVQVCPTDAIVMTKTASDPQFSRQALCLDMARLYANEKSRPISWANATRLVAMQAQEILPSSTQKDEA
jgi:NADH-quinone oxidoreductase subunit I